MGSIRFLLALAVVLNHIKAYPLLSDPSFFLNDAVSGALSVQCFFIISGFYMALVLHEKYTSIKVFYFNRAIKIYSAYYAVLFLGIILALVTGNQTIFSHIIHSGITLGAKFFMAFANLFIIGSDWMMFFFPGKNGLEFTSNFELHPPLYEYHDIPQAWTLPLELMFYLMAPFVVKSKKRLLIIGAASLVCMYLTFIYIGRNDPWSYRFFPSELYLFCLGSLVYHVYVKIRDHKISEYIGLLIWPVMLWYLGRFYLTKTWLGGNPLLSGSDLQLFICTFLALPFIFLATKDNRIDSWFGDLSYPIYLVQHLVITRIAIFPDISSHGPINVLFYTIMISAGIHYIIQYLIVKKYKRKPI